MQIIPVLDLWNGVVVRGVGGRRHEYAPVESVLTRSTRPLDVARAFQERLGLTTLYIADLDGIVRRQPNVGTLCELCDAGFDVWIDAGLRDLADADELLRTGAGKLIAGLESLSGPDVLASLVRTLGTQRIVFSLDLKSGQALTAAEIWPDPSPMGIAATAIQSGVTQMIVLDLASVGEQRGPSTLALCQEIHGLSATCRLTTGGGVRGPEDLRLLQSSGISGVLLSTALHNGSLNAADLSL